MEPTDCFMIHLTGIHHPTLRFHRAKSVIRFSSRRDFRAPTTTFGSTTPTKHIAIGWRGAYQSPQVNVERSSATFSAFRWHNFVFIAPDPPSNLSVSVKSGKIALITWSPPSQGNFTSFKLKILGLSDYQYANKTVMIDDDSFLYQMKDLTPGATYQIQAYTIFEGKESVAYTSRNFTTSEFDRFFLPLFQLIHLIFLF